MLLEGQYLVMDVYEPETLGCIRDVFGRIFMGCSWFYAAGETWIHPYLSRGKKTQDLQCRERHGLYRCCLDK